MKQIFMSVVALIVATGVSVAQTYSLTPNDTIEINGVMEDLQTLSIQQVNNGSDTIILKWQKVSESVPQNWEAAVCDNAICYTSLIQGGTMNPVLPTEYGFVLLHITPHVNYGTAVVRYAVWDEANPTLKDTLTFILTVTDPTSIDETNTNAFAIFPNPVSGSINITSNLQSGFQFAVRDASGKEVQRGSLNSGCEYLSTEGYVNGTYIISISDGNKFITTKKFIVQH